MSWFKSLLVSARCLFLDPVNVRGEVNKLNATTAKFQGDLLHSIYRLEELTKAFYDFDERMQEHALLEQVNRALHYSVPDMFWVKDINGRYIKANDAIRKKLLFCEDPLGKDDRTIAQAVKDKIGDDNHTFGAICGNSDLEVLKHEMPMKFNEDGLVHGEYTMLQVHKNVVRDMKGNVIATVGIGRDITFEVNMLNKAIEETTCEATKATLKQIIDHYRFEDRE